MVTIMLFIVIWQLVGFCILYMDTIAFSALILLVEVGRASERWFVDGGDLTGSSLHIFEFQLAPLQPPYNAVESRMA